MPPRDGAMVETRSIVPAVLACTNVEVNATVPGLVPFSCDAINVCPKFCVLADTNTKPKRLSPDLDWLLSASGIEH